MSACLESLLSNSVTATLLALLVGILGRFRLRPAVLHAMWLLVLLKFVTPPLLSFPSPSKLPWPLRWPQIEVTAGVGSSMSNVDSARFSAVGTPNRLAVASDGTAEPGSASDRVSFDLSPLPTEGDAPVGSMPSGASIHDRRLREAPRSRISNWLPSALAMIWITGSAAWFVLAGMRLMRLHRRIGGTQPADCRFQKVADDVADRMRLRVRPLLQITDATLPPMLISFPRRCVVLLPSELMRGLSASQQAGIIAHELAHFRRGDHWTRWLEFLVVGLYWWHPVAWFARRQLQQAEEFCCDAWVLRLFPDQARGYAQALLATVDFLSEVQTPAPAGASGFGHVRSLQRRLEMILKRTVRPELSPSARMLFLAAALAVLLWTPQAFSQSGAESSAPDLPKADASVRAASSSSVAKPAKPTIEERLDRLEQLIGSLAEVNRAERDRGVKLEPPAAKTANTRPDAEVANRPCDTSFLASRFKHRVSFETGRTQTKDGGRIEIREVWGTRPQIEVGGQYLVRGRYVLPPGERGMLYFYASAGGPWGQTASLDLQSTAVDKQEGEFALIHGMAGPGYFHLILTDAERYSRWFADVYFGTGDNVYRTKPLPTPTSTAAPPAQESVATTLGPKAYREGDVIEISGVTATSGQLEQGDSVTVRGRVRLQSQPSADLSLYLTQTEGNGIEETDPAQIVRVSAGLHDFVLKTTIKHRGALHLTLYDPVAGKPIGGTYFGTADQMQKITKWDVSYYLKK